MIRIIMHFSKTQIGNHFPRLFLQGPTVPLVASLHSKDLDLDVQGLRGISRNKLQDNKDGMEWIMFNYLQYDISKLYTCWW